MSPWTVYWVMQADSIKGLLIGGTIATWFACFIGVFAWFMSKDRHIGNPEINALIGKWIKRLFPAAIACSVAVTFIPDTRTLCAVIAVPAVVNNEQLQADAADIYRLGMERLKEELGAEKPSDE